MRWRVGARATPPVLAFGGALTLGLAVAFLIPASHPAYQIVDGFPISVPVPCETSFHNCGELIALARTAFDQRDPEHDSVVNTTVNSEDLHNPSIFDPSVPHARSGVLFVIVFTLADGSRHATGVYCGVSGCLGLPSYPH